MNSGYTWKEVMELYKKWSETDPSECTCSTHYKQDPTYAIRKIDRTDEEVCKRELRWRRYFKARDEYLRENKITTAKDKIKKALEEFSTAVKH